MAEDSYRQALRQAGKSIEPLIRKQVEEGMSALAPENLELEPGDNDVSIEETRMRVPGGFHPLEYAVGLSSGERIYDRDRERKKTVRIFDEGHVPEQSFPIRDIIVTKTLENGVTKVTSRSSSAYEPATNDEPYCFKDSNFANGKEIMGARDFVEVLGVLNNAKVVYYTNHD